jgi:hypothetical protein
MPEITPSHLTRKPSSATSSGPHVHGTAKRARRRVHWQTLTSFFANLMLDQDNPHKMLKQLFDDTKAKLSYLRDQRRKEMN